MSSFMLALSVTCVLFCSFALIFVVSYAHVFVRIFVVFNRVSLTIVIYVVLITILLLLFMCAYIFLSMFAQTKFISFAPRRLNLFFKL